jgi:hypothetical protein
MKKLLLLVLFFCVRLTVDAQNIVQYEYWYDSNYSSNTVVNTTPESILDLNTSLMGTAGLAPGLHNVSFRAKDTVGKWSSAITEQFYNTGNWNLESYEYWFDDDYASKITTAVSPSQTYILTSNFDTSAAGFGLHALNFRIKDNAGKWSTTIREYFFKSIGGTQLSNSEYWIDSDFANRQPMAFTSSNSVFINQSILTSNLDDQLHTFNFRMQDQGGKWSVVTSTYFMAQSQIVGYEYWFDTDFANKVFTSISPTTLLENLPEFDSRSLSVGDHVVHFRAKNNSGKYSTTIAQTFSVIVTAPPIASNQELFGAPTVANLVATGTDLKWYISESSETALVSTTVLSTGTYYVSQTIDSRESIRIPVVVTVTFIIPTSLTFCKGAKVSDALGTSTMKFYASATKGSALAPTITLATKTYYVTQTVNGIETTPRTAVPVTVNLLPTTPAVALTLGTEVIKKVGNLIGTSTALTLTATPVGAVTTASYNWTLPTNVTQVSGGSSAVITVNFAAVAPGNTALDFFVSSVSNNGCISKTAKKLTVTRAEPAKPKALVLTDALRPELLKITKLGEYTGALNTRTLTLTATPVDKQGSQATSYKWVLPAGVTTTATATTTANTYTSTLPTIAITLAGVTNQASFLFQVYAVNGNGTSLLSKDLTCSSAAPKTPGAITTPALAKPTYNTTCNNSITVQVPAVLGATYNWSVSGGAVITSGQGSNVIAINTSAASATLTISVTASNGTGTSLPKVLLLKKATTCKVEATDNVVADDQLTVIAFPNPSSDEFTIESSRKGASVKVYDMLGRLIENRQATSNSVQMGRNYATGVYNVVVSQGNKAKTLKVIIIPIMYIF